MNSTSGLHPGKEHDWELCFLHPKNLQCEYMTSSSVELCKLIQVESLDVKNSFRDIFRFLEATIIALGHCFLVPFPWKACLNLLSIDDGFRP